MLWKVRHNGRNKKELYEWLMHFYFWWVWQQVTGEPGHVAKCRLRICEQTHRKGGQGSYLTLKHSSCVANLLLFVHLFTIHCIQIQSVTNNIHLKWKMGIEFKAISVNHVFLSKRALNVYSPLAVRCAKGTPKPCEKHELPKISIRQK